MSFWSSQGRPDPTCCCSSDGHELNRDGKRVLSQLERTAKLGRMSSEVQSIPAVEDALQTLRSRRMSEYRQEVYIDPLAKSNAQAPDDENLFPLMDKVKEFLKSERQVMLVLGDSGVGKSTFNRHLEYELWRKYKPGGRIPLFINLPELDRPDKNLIAEHLKSSNFSEEGVCELKHHRQMLLICDGYDESRLRVNLHTTNALNRSGPQDVKLLITCRTQYLGPDYRDRFVPSISGGYHRPEDALFQEAVIAPYTKDQIEMYVEKYVSLEPRTWATKDYMDKLTTIPNLMDLVKNPFLLTLALETLPKVVEGSLDLSRLRVTRAQLYDMFVNCWIGVSKRRLQERQQIESHQEALEELLEDGFVDNGIRFQEDLAAAIYKEQEGKPVVDYVHKRDKYTWKVAFFSPGPETSVLRSASLLSRAGTQYRFIHQSLLEYFYSRAICGAASKYTDPTAIPLMIIDHPLSKMSLVAEVSVIHFLAQHAQQNATFKQHLLALIELSKSDVQASQAAANAITILVKAGTRFNGADFRRICVPGADLSAGQFDSAQLQEADLTGVNLTKAWIRQVDFSGAQMGGTQFGELPYLPDAGNVWACAFSPDGKSFATGLVKGDIDIYSTATWKKTTTFRAHKMCVTGLAFSPTGHQLLSGSEDTTVRLWDFETGSVDMCLDGWCDRVMGLAFSSSGKQFALAGSNSSVWDARTGAVVFDLKEHMGWSANVEFSPDGNLVAFSSHKGRIQVYNTFNGSPEVVLENEPYDITDIAFSPNGRWIVASNVTGNLQLWETETAVSGLRWNGHAGIVMAISFSPDSRSIVSCAYDGSVKLWDVYTGSMISAFTGHLQSVNCVTFTPDGSRIASASSDSTVRLWEVATGGLRLDAQEYSDPQVSVAYSPDGRFLVSVSRSGILRHYDADTGETDIAFSGQPDGTDCVAYSPDGSRVAVGGYGEEVVVLKVQVGTFEVALRIRTMGVNAVAFSPCGDWIASANKDQTVRLWQASTGAPGLVFTGQDDVVESVVFSPCGLEVASGCRNGDIRIWETNTGILKSSMTTRSSGPGIVAFLQGRRQVASSFGKGGVAVWDSQCKEFRSMLMPQLEINTFTFSPCGRWMVAVQCPGSPVELYVG
ncbi:hypothetical protein KI688_001710 [Linnemannia hyalina]|uniref:NACHT domain-containing protein n=1 Tax=Linnemannia hyalina TaxID=64524 RepID=A0A9P7XTR3_9FUNG|nr:hypothetical protein KI688_001710 [Linnemannia hyalina]